ncbi:hypothetical protein GN956_G15153 [Arapaima gigas]
MSTRETPAAAAFRCRSLEDGTEPRRRAEGWKGSTARRVNGINKRRSNKRPSSGALTCPDPQELRFRIGFAPSTASASRRFRAQDADRIPPGDGRGGRAAASPPSDLHLHPQLLAPPSSPLCRCAIRPQI